jgi:hypothetical protein
MSEPTPTPTTGDITRAAVTSQLERYVEEMALGRPISDQEGSANQYLLWVTIKNMVSLDGAEFAQTYATFLDIIAAHRQSAFSEKAVYRTFDGSRIHPGDERKMARFMNLALATADRATRLLGLRQVNLQSTFKDWDHQLLMKMEAFYSL